MTKDLIFARKASGRIGVYAKGNALFTQGVVRIGTIKQSPTTGEHFFFQEIIHGWGTRLEKDTMQAITDELRRLDMLMGGE